MKKSMAILLLVILLFSSNLLTACGVGLDQQTLDTLNNAITTLNNQPQAWQAVLDDTIKELGDRVSDVVQEVKVVAKDLGQSATALAMCAVDFLGLRAKDSLIYIRDSYLHRIDPNKYPAPHPPSPHYCLLNPDSIALTRDSGGHLAFKYKDDQHTIVRIGGFNFRSDNLPTVVLQNTNHTTVRTSKAVVTFSTKYMLNVNFQPEDFLGVQKGYNFVLKWIDSPDTPTLPISIEDLQPPIYRVKITFNSLTLYEDEEAGDTHMAVYLYMDVGGRRTYLFNWNNCSYKVNETNTYHNMTSCGTGNSSFTTTTPFELGVLGYTHDDVSWPSRNTNENFLGGASLSIDPKRPGTYTLGPTVTDNNNKGFSMSISVTRV